MTLLPAVVPVTVPAAKSAVVPARLAMKVAPLFGIRTPSSPYGLTWVCDYSKVSLLEIARGAPNPTRADASRWGGQVPSGRWQVVNRSVLTHRPKGAARPEQLPDEIANATLNRYGPDTKAAVILTAANALLAPVTRAIGEALEFIGRQVPAPPRTLLAAWSALVLEVFRSQPALFAAAVQARAIQRAALLRWQLPAAEHDTGARAELSDAASDGWEPGSVVSPVRLEVVDSTLAALPLLASGQRGADVRDARREARADVLSRELLDRLLALGTLEGDGYLWITDRGGGNLAVEALTPHYPTLKRYLRDIAELVGPAYGGEDPVRSPMPPVPRPDQIAEYGVLTRRAVVIAVATMVWLAFDQGDPDPEQLDPIQDTLADLAFLAREGLPVNDPVRAVTLCRIADMRLESLRQDEANDEQLGPAVRDLLGHLDRCVALADTGGLNRSDAAELIWSANGELAIVLRRHAETPVAGLPRPKVLTDGLFRLWETYLRLAEIDVDRLPTQVEAVRRRVGFQLHNYATFLAGRGRTEAEVRAGYDLFDRYVLPAREAFYRRTGDFVPLLNSCQNVTRATTRLAELAAARGDLDSARQYAERGRNWIQQARHHPDTEQKLQRATDAATRFILLAAPAMLTAVELGATDSVAEDLADCEQLLATAQAFANGISKAGGRYSRADEIFEIERRLRTAVRAAGRGQPGVIRRPGGPSAPVAPVTGTSGRRSAERGRS